MTDRVHPASFRDPSGFLFSRSARLFRQVNRPYQPDYDLLFSSGLYGHLTEKGWLIPHRESDVEPPLPQIAYKVIQPEVVPFISYPYEWCFSQLKDAALLTLKIQSQAIRHGMSLKDASAYNVQFLGGKPVFIDTLSFTKFTKGEPWAAYRQFCQHFLAPLALMACTDAQLNQLMRIYMDGIPLPLASKLLPRNTYLNPGLLIHLHLHARMQQQAAAFQGGPLARRPMAPSAILGLVDSLRETIRALEWNPANTKWGEYYERNNYTENSFREKQRLVGVFLRRITPGRVWDLGGNTGVFSRIAVEAGWDAICFDNDYGAVEKNYREARAQKETRLLPLMLDLTNPSPALGWNNRERESILDRGGADAVLALAIIHHLAIGNNLPLEQVAEFLARCGTWLIVEFIPKEDSQVRTLLQMRHDIFADYSREKFETEFRQAFTIEDSVPIPESSRVLYLMRKRE